MTDHTRLGMTQHSQTPYDKEIIASEAELGPAAHGNIGAQILRAERAGYLTGIAVNRQKLEAFESLLAALEIFANPTAWARQGDSHAIPVQAILIAQVAIAKATSPTGPSGWGRAKEGSHDVER